MTVLPGHEDLRDKEVVGFDPVRCRMIVMVGGKEVPYKMLLSPGGQIHGVPDVPDTLPDQAGERERVPVEMRWRGCDQR